MDTEKHTTVRISRRLRDIITEYKEGKELAGDTLERLIKAYLDPEIKV